MFSSRLFSKLRLFAVLGFVLLLGLSAIGSEMDIEVGDRVRLIDRTDAVVIEIIKDRIGNAVAVEDAGGKITIWYDFQLSNDYNYLGQPPSDYTDRFERNTVVLRKNGNMQHIDKVSTKDGQKIAVFGSSGEDWEYLSMLRPMHFEDIYREARANRQAALSSRSSAVRSAESGNTSSTKPKSNAAANSVPMRLPDIPDISVQSVDGGDQNAWGLIKRFSRDLVEEARKANWQYTDDPDLRIVEDNILRGLLMPEGGSIKVLAPAGVGKSILIQRLMARIAKGDIPNSLKNYRFMEISPSELEAGTSRIGAIEAKLDAMKEMSKAIPLVWIGDEFHSFAAIGKHSKNDNNIFQSLKPDVASGVLKFIGLSTPDEWAAAFESDEAFDRRFIRVNIDEPTGERLVRILKSWIKKYNLEELSPDLLNEAIRLADEFSVEGAQPSRTTKLLSVLYSENQMNPGEITRADLFSAAKRLWNIDPAEFTPQKRRERLEKLKASLGQLAGQEAVKEAIIDKAEEILVGMHDRSKPRYRLIFPGPKGQGKTKIVKIFSAAMGLPEDNRILMSSFSTPHHVDEMRSQIASYVVRNPFTVLFLDEFEKAHPSVQKAVLGILDTGFITYEVKVGGKPVSKTLRLKNTTIFVATNAGQGYISSLKDRSELNESRLRDAMEKDGLDEFVLDRMAQIVPFFYLSKEEFNEVLRIHFEEALKEIEKNTRVKVTIANQDKMIIALSDKFFTPQMSNREASRIVESYIRRPIKNALISRDDMGSTLSMKWTGSELSPTSGGGDSYGGSCRRLVE